MTKHPGTGEKVTAMCSVKSVNGKVCLDSRQSRSHIHSQSKWQNTSCIRQSDWHTSLSCRVQRVLGLARLVRLESLARQRICFFRVSSSLCITRYSQGRKQEKNLLFGRGRGTGHGGGSGSFPQEDEARLRLRFGLTFKS